MDVVKVYKDYSILGHLDVIKRYDKQGEIEFEKIQDLIEQIFEVVIADGKGIELNTYLSFFPFLQNKHHNHN